MDEKAIKSKKDLITLLILLAIGWLVIGGIHFASYSTDGNKISLYDGIYNFFSGLIFILASLLTYKGKIIVIVIPILFGIAGITYAVLMERGFNYFALLIAVIYLIWILSLRKNKLLN